VGQAMCQPRSSAYRPSDGMRIGASTVSQTVPRGKAVGVRPSYHSHNDVYDYRPPIAAAYYDQVSGHFENDGRKLGVVIESHGMPPAGSTFAVSLIVVERDDGTFTGAGCRIRGRPRTPSVNKSGSAVLAGATEGTVTTSCPPISPCQGCRLARAALTTLLSPTPTFEIADGDHRGGHRDYTPFQKDTAVVRLVWKLPANDAA